MSTLKEKWFFLCIWIVLVLISQNINIGLPVVDNLVAFACSSVILPLIGNFVSLPMTGVLTGLLWFGIHLEIPIPLTMGIPTFCAALSWYASKNPRGMSSLLFHLVLPLVCMVLFYVSPPGEKAWPYALFWCVPVAMYFVAFKHPERILPRALMSTFVQHALGSIMWVYWVPMGSDQWLGLIPTVALERFMMTTLSVGFFIVLKTVYEGKKAIPSFSRLSF